MNHCEWCGESSSEELGEVEEYVTSPPVDGHEVETAFLHAKCDSEKALVEYA